MTKTAARVAIILLVGAGLALAAFAWQSQRKQSLGRSLLAEFKADLSGLGIGPDAASYVEGLADHFHADAYQSSFGPDAPSLGGTTDVNQYHRAMLDAMVARARADGQAALADALAEFRSLRADVEPSGTGGSGP